MGNNSSEIKEFGLDDHTTNLIGRAVENKFKQVLDNPWKQNWKVMSAIVMTDQNDKNFVDVICVNTGNKLINERNFSGNGEAVIDSHSEVLSRRSLIRYLWKQIQSFIENNGKNDILEKVGSGHGLRLKPNLRLHLFLSTAPCGGVRAFSLNEKEGDARPNRMNRNLLRVKLGDGEGYQPVDEFNRANRFGLMSCTDKILLWNVVGVQGSLLSYFLEPIYLYSVVLSSVYNYEHLTRLLNNRVVGCTEFPVNQLKVAEFIPEYNSVLINETKTVPNYSINWIKCENRVEVLYSGNGRTEFGGTGILAKRSLFNRYRDVLSQINSRNANKSIFQSFIEYISGSSYLDILLDPNSNPEQLVDFNYREAKDGSNKYQNMKKALETELKHRGYGTWSHLKHLRLNLDQFDI